MTKLDKTQLPPTILADKAPRIVAWLAQKRAGEGLAQFKLRRLNRLGRNQKRCNVYVADELVSSEHARIKYEGNHFMLYDLASLNGTYLNGKRIASPELLMDGDVIKLGNTELIFKQA